MKSGSTENNKFDLTFAVLAGLSMFYFNSITGGFLLDPISKVLFFFLLALECILINSQMNKATLSKK
jgi:hypothetical protein